ncbi:MAG: hypothetical protein KGL11_15520 [Alphaproteobacteria bacterium]|nr:hypothetical protein [Alphaproteobacteria bacterium]
MPLAAAAQTKSLPSRENDQGQVMVTVTPLALSNTADPWRFDVQINTHVAPITQDLAAVSVLNDGKGHKEKASAWQGDPPGGHHRHGVLIFKPITPLPESVTLTIRQVGAVPVRTFAWKLSNP